MTDTQNLLFGTVWSVLIPECANVMQWDAAGGPSVTRILVLTELPMSATVTWTSTHARTFVAMAGFVVNCFLLTVALSSSLIRGSDIPGEFPASTTGFPAGADNHSRFEVGNSSARAEMSRMMERHLLRMLKLSSRPPARAGESLVPGYIRALQHAVDTAPLSTSAVNDDDDGDHLTWAVKALQGIYQSTLDWLGHPMTPQWAGGRGRGNCHLNFRASEKNFCCCKKKFSSKNTK